MTHVLGKKEKAVLEVMSKPKTPAEIHEEINFSRNINISSIIRILSEKGFILCLNPNMSLGRVYGLTLKGQKYRKRIVNQSYFQMPEIDWYLYGWLACGKQKKAVLKALNRPLPLKYIRERAHTYNAKISRTNANDLLQLFVKKKIAIKTKHGRYVLFGLTKTGQQLREQLFKP